MDEHVFAPRDRVDGWTGVDDLGTNYGSGYDDGSGDTG